MNISVKSVYDWYHNTLVNPKYRWWVILGTLVYVISPIDIAPDFLPIAGQVDDIMILTLLLTELSRLVLDFARNRKNQTVESHDDNAQTSQGTVDVNAVSMD